MVQINIGDLVHRKNEPARVGKVLEIVNDEQLGEQLARVQFGDRTQTVIVGSLVQFTPGERDMWHDMEEGRRSGATAFRTLLTFVRLKTPPSPIVSAFGSARVRFYPYQFKPVLKFLENPSQRLLIADDVGLGKTIEAGYILREWRARHEMEHVLIIVPARLMHKWQVELSRRFDENFIIVKSKEIRAALEKVQRGQDLPDFNWITSYESIRSEKMIQLFDDVRPSLDFLILDEAHRVRNRGTKQFGCANILKDCADAMIYLSATPVQTGLDNLYTLSSLLMPDTFSSYSMFEQIVESNKPIIRACQYVSSGNLAKASEELMSLDTNDLTRPLSKDPYFQEIIQRLRGTVSTDRPAIIRLQRDISDFSLLGHLISRTRKVEVMENWPPREPQSPRIDLTPDEMEIYKSVKNIMRLLNPNMGSWGATMASITAYRYTASCIPAAAAYFQERLDAGTLVPSGGNQIASGDLGDDGVFDDIEDAQNTAIEISDALRREILVILDKCPKPGTDSKFLGLLAAIEEIWQDDAKNRQPKRKLVVFSFFRRTLQYLNKQLLARGSQVRLIHGDIPMDERQVCIEEFLENNEINILLSSEVGGEGIDLQKASIIVNYDLPWNPMVVEQRIGRIDRIGQEAKKMIILNLVARDTVEERILFRLYERIGLFRETIGEMDEIVGPQELQKLMVDALCGGLTEEQLQKQIDITIKAAEEKVAEARKLSQESDRLLAADQVFLDEINTLISSRRVPDTVDLKILLMDILESRYSGIHYEEGLDDKPGSLALGRDATSAFDDWSRKYSFDAHRTAQRFQQHGKIPVTFDAEVAMEHPRTEFIQNRHSLIQFAVHLLEQDLGKQITSFALQVSGNQLPKGVWLLGVWSIMLQSTRTETRLEAVACNLRTEEVLSGQEADKLLVACLGTSLDLDVDMLKPDKDAINRCTELIKNGYRQRRASIVKEAKEIGDRKLARARTTWLQSLTIRKDAAQKRIDDLKASQAKEFAIRMAEAILEKRLKALQQKQEEFTQTTRLEWEDHEIASVLVSAV